MNRWNQVSALFSEALELPPGDRTRYLIGACAEDDDLRREVESLLAAHLDADGDFLQQDQVPRLVQWGEEETDLPTHVGPWRVLSEIGRGGMGVVYEARRDDGQFEQLAALKLIKRGMDSDQYLERFLRERQILAGMEHAGIARLLDGGVTPEGRPWFALERIDGVHFTQYSKEKHLSLEQRLRLFNEICSAVEYAHRNLIVHRDLKPSNVLVDGAGRVKLLDFGIAKILRNSDDAKGTRTVSGRRFVTPGYGAPELLLGGAVTTATDVYSLGIMLYELLAGQLPEGLPYGGSPVSVPESVGPLSPGHANFVAKAAIRRGLGRDLANITAKATQLEPERRYVSAEALREDIERYLRGEPVRACPDSVAYRVSKFLKRHRTSAIAAGLVVLSLLVGLGTALWQAGVAARERDIAREETEEAEQVKRFMVDLFRTSEPRVPDDAELTAKQLLDRGLERVRSELEDRPDLRAELLTTIGDVVTSLGDHEGAIQLFEEAAAIDLGPGGRNQLRLAAALNGIGVASAFLGDAESAESHHRRALAIRSEYSSADSLLTSQSLNNLGAALTSQRKMPEAIELYERSLRIQQRLAGPDEVPTLQTLANLGTAYRYQGDYLLAEQMLLGVIERMTRRQKSRHPDMVYHLANLGSIKSRLGKVREEESLLRQSFELSKEFWGESHPETRLSMNNFALAAHALGHDTEAEALMRKTLTYDIEQYGLEHTFVAIGRNNLGRILVELGRVDEALVQFEIADVLHEKLSSPRTLTTHHLRYAAVHLAVGNLTTARQLVDRALAVERQRKPPSSEKLATAIMTSASIRSALGLESEAEHLFQEALQIVKARASSHHPDAGIAHLGLGELYLEQGRIVEARHALEQAAEVWAVTLPEDHWRRAEAKVVFGACEIRDGNLERGHQLMDEGIDQLSRDRGSGHWRTRAAIARKEALL